jgi:hypothetical protein
MVAQIIALHCLTVFWLMLAPFLCVVDAMDAVLCGCTSLALDSWDVSSGPCSESVLVYLSGYKFYLLHASGASPSLFCQAGVLHGVVRFPPRVVWL